MFQSANLNFYREDDAHPTPMVFLDQAFWEGGSGASGALPVFPLVAALGARARSPFKEALLISDSEDDIAQFIVRANVDKLDRLRVADLRLARA